MARRILWLLPLLLLAGAVFALPSGLRLGAEHWLQQQGLQAKIDDVDLNLFTGRLAIRGVTLSNTDKRGLALESIEVALHHAPLLQKRIHLSELKVQGLKLDVARNLDGNNGLEIAGIQIQASEDSASNSWGFGLDKTQIDRSVITYSDPLIRQSITLQAGNIGELATWAEGQAIQIDSSAAMAGGELHIQGQIQPFGEHISAELTVQAGGLPLASIAPLIPDDSVRLDGLLHADLMLKLDYQADAEIKLELQGDSRLRNYQAGLANPALDIGGKMLQWQGQLQLATRPDQKPSISSSGKLAASQLTATERKTRLKLIGLESLNISQLQLKALDNIQLAGVTLSAGHGLSEPEAEPLIRWQSANLQSLSFSAGDLALGPITVTGIDGELKRDAAGQWNIQQVIATAFNPEITPSSTENEQANSQRALLQVAAISINNSHLDFEDQSLEPPLKLKLQAFNGRIEHLDNSQPDTPSPVQISSKVGDYGKLDLQGEVKPFSTPPATNIKGKISGIDTVPMSGLTRKLVGHRIKQGTVSGDLDINIDQGRLNSSVNLVLNKLQIAAVKGQAGQFEKSSGMPLGTALGLLRDRDENIRLKLPISGAIDKPDFDINNILQQAIFKAVSTAALAFYSPLGVITVGDKLLQLATALRFDPVLFAAGSSELDTAAISQLAQLTDVLIQRPALQITLCGIAAPADRNVVAEQIAGENSRLFGLYRPEAEPDAVPEERLLELARQRTRQVGNYLSTHGIDPGRLIVCDGEISSKAKAKPGVRIEL